MKTFNRVNLPKEIKYNNKVYKRGEKTDKSIQINVLSTRLKGASDLHGHPYMPVKHYFNPID